MYCSQPVGQYNLVQPPGVYPKSQPSTRLTIDSADKVSTRPPQSNDLFCIFYWDDKWQPGMSRIAGHNEQIIAWVLTSGEGIGPTLNK